MFQAELSNGEIVDVDEQFVNDCLDNLPEFREVRCCCTPDNLIGYLPAEVTDYEVLELEGGGSAFNSQDEEELIRARPDFRETVGTGVVLDPAPEQAGPKSPKTWKKTWRKK